MCQNNTEENVHYKENELFKKFKERLLKISDEYGDDAGVQLFKKKLEQATSFKDLSDNS